MSLKPDTGVHPRSKDSFVTIVAMDCEYVGVGPNGEEDQLARVSVLDVRGRSIYDEFVKPVQEVVDYRTAVSGIRAGHLRSSSAKHFSVVQKEVKELLINNVLVGHGLRNDLRVSYLHSCLSQVSLMISDSIPGPRSHSSRQTGQGHGCLPSTA